MNISFIISTLKRYRTALLLILIVSVGFTLRSYGRNWDNYGHLHPDERMLIMVAERIQFPDNLYPDFFNYGSLPIYLLKGTSQLVKELTGFNFATYDGMLILGRFLSSLADTVVLLLIYAISRMLTKGSSVSLLAALCYAIAVFPIQNSHFFVVDVYMNLFITAVVAFFLWFVKSKRPLALGLMSVSMGAAIATKFTAVAFLPGVLVSLCVLMYINQSKRSLKNLLTIPLKLFFVLILTCATFAVCMPYAILPPSGLLTPAATSSIPQGITDVVRFADPEYMPQTRFLRDIKEQTRMNNDAYVFPYTLQYVTTKPYLYYLEQIALWGLGVPMSLFVVVGVLALLRKAYPFRSLRQRVRPPFFLVHAFMIFLSMYGLYFLVVGRSAVKFMRYMLPLYPILVLFAGYGVFFVARAGLKLLRIKKISSLLSSTLPYIFLFLLTLLLGSWTLAFMHIYTKPHTRIAATEWILRNIPSGSTLAVEHWDDRVPIQYGERYLYEEMTIYNQPDDMQKWETLVEKLRKSEYLILASNRLYIPLPKLKDCGRYKFCYPLTASYYKSLFDGSLGYKMVKEFESYPGFGPWVIKDDIADESFTVYEHPKIIIFKRNKLLPVPSISAL